MKPPGFAQMREDGQWNLSVVPIISADIHKRLALRAALDQNAGERHTIEEIDALTGCHNRRLLAVAPLARLHTADDKALRLQDRSDLRTRARDAA